MSKINLLDVIPVLKPYITLYEKEDGKVRLGIRRFKTNWFHKHFFVKMLSREITVNFDEISSEVLRYIDGQRSVSQLILCLEEVSEDYKNDDFRERILLFIRNLHRDKLIDYLTK